MPSASLPRRGSGLGNRATSLLTHVNNRDGAAIDPVAEGAQNKSIFNGALSRTMIIRIAIAAAALVLAGCSNAPLPSLTTGSLFGSKPDAQAASAAPAAPVVRNDPTSRTLQVSRVAAKATRCGFYFDPVKLRSTFLAAEGAQGGTDAAELAKLEKVYGSSFNGTTKAVSADENYCTDTRTAHVKADLARHLAGDYAPGAPMKQQDDDDGGLFSGSGGLFDSSSNGTYKSPTLPTDNR
jgi:hypothetical protein